MPKVIVDDPDEDEAFDWIDERPLRRARRPLPWLRMFLLSCMSVAGLAYLARQTERDDSRGDAGAVPKAVLIAPAPSWRPLPPSPPLYAVERSAEPVGVEARQHVSGGREDTLVLGTLEGPGYGRISLVHGFAEPNRSFFIDLVRRAAEAGLSVSRNAQSRLVPTKFGPVEAAAVTLAGPVERNCQAFRFADPETVFGFQGWLCDGDEAVDETRLACFIDRVILTGDNPSLKAVFARAERNRLAACAPGPRTASAGIRTPVRQ